MCIWDNKLERPCESPQEPYHTENTVAPFIGTGEVLPSLPAVPLHLLKNRYPAFRITLP